MSGQSTLDRWVAHLGWTLTVTGVPFRITRNDRHWLAKFRYSMSHEQRIRRSWHAVKGLGVSALNTATSSKPRFMYQTSRVCGNSANNLAGPTPAAGHVPFSLRTICPNAHVPYPLTRQSPRILSETRASTKGTEKADYKVLSWGSMHYFQQHLFFHVIVPPPPQRDRTDGSVGGAHSLPDQTPY